MQPVCSSVENPSGSRRVRGQNNLALLVTRIRAFFRAQTACPNPVLARRRAGLTTPRDIQGHAEGEAICDVGQFRSFGTAGAVASGIRISLYTVRGEYYEYRNCRSLRHPHLARF